MAGSRCPPSERAETSPPLVPVEGDEFAAPKDAFSGASEVVLDPSALAEAGACLAIAAGSALGDAPLPGPCAPRVPIASMSPPSALPAPGDPALPWSALDGAPFSAPAVACKPPGAPGSEPTLGAAALPGPPAPSPDPSTALPSAIGLPPGWGSPGGAPSYCQGFWVVGVLEPLAMRGNKAPPVPPPPAARVPLSPACRWPPSGGPSAGGEEDRADLAGLLDPRVPVVTAPGVLVVVDPGVVGVAGAGVMGVEPDVLPEEEPDALEEEEAGPPTPETAGLAGFAGLATPSGLAGLATPSGFAGLATLEGRSEEGVAGASPLDDDAAAVRGAAGGVDVPSSCAGAPSASGEALATAGETSHVVSPAAGFPGAGGVGRLALGPGTTDHELDAPETASKASPKLGVEVGSTSEHCAASVDDSSPRLDATSTPVASPEPTGAGMLMRPPPATP